MVEETEEKEKAPASGLCCVYSTDNTCGNCMNWSTSDWCNKSAENCAACGTWCSYETKEPEEKEEVKETEEKLEEEKSAQTEEKKEAPASGKCCVYSTDNTCGNC